MLETVLLDLDETLLDFRASERAAISGTLSALGIPPTEAIIARYSAINQRCWEGLERRELTRQQVLHRRFRELFGELGVHVSPEAAQAIYAPILASGHSLMPGALELMETLQGRCRLFALSNGSGEIQDRRLRESGLDRYFEQVFVSGRMGADKPDPAFFEACFAAIPGFRRETSVMVGDSLTSDILGGKGAGLRTVWVNLRGKPPREDIRPDRICTSLEDLPAILEGL